MELLTIGESFHANKEARLDISSIAVGTMSGPLLGEVAGIGPPYQDMILVSTGEVNVALTALSPTQESALEQRFRKLADQWRKETGHFSSATKKIIHPAYQQIIGMGREAVPLIIRELKRTQGHWFWALFAITGEDPAPEVSTFTEAVEAWLSWGIHHGYATPD